MQSQLVVLGLGSNLNPLENLRQALLLLRRQDDFKVLKVSRIYESEAQLPQGAPESWRKNYLNAAVLLEVENFHPLELLKKIKKIETDMGRVSAERWAPRVIDLDILFVKNFEFQNTELTIPHPMLFSRPFAWRPAKEVYAELPAAQFSEGLNTQVSERYFWPERAAIINVTPDSFSDGGKFTTSESFFQYATQLIAHGADYLDIGAESTRPQAQPITSEVEISRLKFAFEVLKDLKCKVSLDSRHFETIRYIADNYQLDLINDVSGLSDQRIIDLVKKNKFKAVCMHSLTVPADKNVTLKNDNPIPEIIDWWNKKHLGMEDQIYFDPGFGFGKTTAQSWMMFNHLEQFKPIKNKFFLGYSRKSFLKEKNISTEQATCQLNLAFAQIIRVHDL